VKLSAGAPLLIRMRGVRRIRLNALDYDANKSLVVPSALLSLREIKKQAELHPGSTLLIVGHTDASGEPGPNLDLSLERAEALAAFLQEDADAWEAFFRESRPSGRRWGARELQLMLSVLPDGGEKFYAGPIDGSQGPAMTAALKRFQREAGLEADGIAGPKTRQALFAAYFKLDGAALPADIRVVAHGCGEGFPTGGSAASDRRVEIFFFAAPIDPAPSADRKSGPGASDYPKWLEQVLETVDIG
jgi:peptidoglycan hydrolase-like protein with peptidoglycan-binding domain